jgi:hypothetical protein
MVDLHALSMIGTALLLLEARTAAIAVSDGFGNPLRILRFRSMGGILVVTARLI